MKAYPQNSRLAININDLRFEAIFREIGGLFGKEGIPLILLKGPHLAHTVYDHPHERAYGDLDVLVKPADFRRAAEILMDHQYVLLEEAEKNLATTAQANHWAFSSRLGQLIELHRGFTGLERHPLNLDDWFARAEKFKFGQTEALGLGAEDLLCHLCLHVGKSFFYLIEEKHIRDLDAVIRNRAICWQGFVDRCQVTRSQAIAFYCLRSTQTRFGTPIPPEVIAALRPGKLRLLWLDKHLDVTAYPIYRFHVGGVNHARRRLTLPLLDGGFASWLPFMARVAWVRGLDLLLRVPLLGRRWKSRFDA